jgi:hypothetical protein
MTTKPLAIATSFLFSAAVLPAATNITLVQWGEAAGNTGIVESTQPVTTESDFLSGDVDSPIGASYYPNATGRNPDFNVAGSVNTWSIDVKQNTSGGDTINFSNQSSAEINSIVIWEDFSPMTAVLDYAFSLNISGGENSPEYATYEFVMQDSAGIWYISDTGNNFNSNASNVNASDITWYGYTPYGADLTGEESKSPTIAGAQAFGYRQEMSNGSLDKDIDVSYFQVIAVVPEPSSAALLGLGGLVMALRRKRG